MGIAYALQAALRVVLQTELNLVSVERNLQYCTAVEREEASSCGRKPSRTSTAAAVGDDWPMQGSIVFKDVELRYRAELPLALRSVSFAIAPEERVGVVGRSGSGKSSCVAALLRLVELHSGCILIDGVDISTLPLSRLRGAISVVMQDALMFSGDVKYNLDPSGIHTDEELMSVLRRVKLCAKDAVSAKAKLSDTVGEAGDNWSAGQRQLMCLARAVLRGCKVMLCDEATSSIDAETDAIVQCVLKSARYTMLVIAHRLETILDSDRILLMDQGVLAEQGMPEELRVKEGGRFAALLAAREHDK